MKIVLLPIFIFFYLAAVAQKADTLSGIVVDSVNNKPIPFATITINGTKIGTITDTDGRFYLRSMPQDSVVVQHVTHFNKKIRYQPGDTVFLVPDVIMLETVYILSDTLPLAFKREQEPVDYPSFSRLPDDYYEARIKELYHLPSKGLGTGVTEGLYRFFNKKKYEQLYRLQEIYEEEDRANAYKELHDARLSVSRIQNVLDCGAFYAEQVKEEFQPSMEYLQAVSDYQLIYDLRKFAKDFSLYKFESGN